MRILLLTSAYHPHKGGVEQLVSQLARSYREMGHHVQVIAPRWPRALAASDIVDGQLVRRLSMPMPSWHVRSLASFLLRTFPSAGQLIYIGARWHADVVHVQCVGPNGLYALVLAQCLRLPLVVTSQGEQTMDATGLYQRSRVQRWVLRKLLRRADAVTACSADALTNLKQFGDWDVTSEVIPNGINPEEATLASEQSPHPRSYVFALGRHVQNKGFAILLQAFASTLRQHPNVDLILAGDGPDHQNLVRQAEKLGLGGRVVFPGLIDRGTVATYFRHGCFFVLPSLREPFGIVALEAMSAGKAVIATAAGGIPEFVTHGKNGLLVPPRDIHALASAMCRLLDDPSFAKQLGATGEKIAHGRFTWQQISAQYVDIYEQVRKPRTDNISSCAALGDLNVQDEVTLP